MQRTLQWGTRAQPTRRGLTVDAINIGIYGHIPDRVQTRTRLPRGAYPAVGIPEIGGYHLRDAYQLWADNAGELYEEAPVAITFPSVEWFQALADIANEDQHFKKFGALDAITAWKVGAKVSNVTFDVLDVRDVREASEAEMRDADFVIELQPDQWQQMIEDIKANQTAGREWTLNSLDISADEPIHFSAADDGYRADKFFRYNPSLRVFIDNASQLDTVFDLATATA